MDREPLYTQLVRRLATPEGILGSMAIMPWKMTRKERERVINMSRHKIVALREAHRFTLDDKFTSLVSRIALTEPHVTAMMLPFVRMPYENVWIEWDAKAAHIEGVHGAPPGPGRREGVLLRLAEHRGHPSIVILQVFETQDDKRREWVQVVNPQQIALRPQGDVYEPEHSSPLIHTHNPAVIDAMHRKMTVEQRDDYEGRVTLRIGDKGNVIDWIDALPSDTETRMLAREQLQRAAFLARDTGTIVMTILGLMNLHAVTSHTLRIGDGKRHEGLKANDWRLKYEHHVVELVRPDTTVKMITNIVGDGLPTHDRRLHDVIGHWRVKKAVRGCPHRWQAVAEERDLMRCTQCGASRGWVRSHQRGNAMLGVVTKEYEVVGR